MPTTDTFDSSFQADATQPDCADERRRFAYHRNDGGTERFIARFWTHPGSGEPLVDIEQDGKRVDTVRRTKFAAYRTLRRVVTEDAMSDAHALHEEISRRFPGREHAAVCEEALGRELASDHLSSLTQRERDRVRSWMAEQQVDEDVPTWEDAQEEIAELF